MIKVQDLSKIYKLYNQPQDRLKEALHPLRKKYHHDFYALKGLDFKIKKGETVGIIGKNGSGKSTLLKILTGVLTPSGGTYEVGGKISSLLELGAGFNPELSGLENVYFNGSVLGFTKEEMESKLDEIITFADIGEFIHQPVKTYSSGMYVRLAFAVAINVDPDILIIDEALSVGDIRFQLKCFRKFREFQEAGKTILFVTHDTGAVMNYCSRAIWLDDGGIKEMGDPENVCKNYSSFMAYDAESSNKEGVSKTAKSLSSENKESILHTSNDEWREDCIISVSPFTPKEYFGDGRAIITNAGFLQCNKETDTLEGEKLVTFFIETEVNKSITSPAIGFVVKNEKGVILYDLSSYFPLENQNISFEGGMFVRAEFSYLMPILSRGDFLISVALVDGDAFNHKVVHWLHDVIGLSVLNSSFMQGNMGVFNPTVSIKIYNEDN